MHGFCRPAIKYLKLLIIFVAKVVVIFHSALFRVIFIALLSVPQLAVALSVESDVKCVKSALNGKDLVMLVENFLRNSSIGTYDKIELDVVGSLPEMPQSSMSLKSSWPASRIAIEFSWMDCGSVSVKKLVWFKVKASRKVLVYGKDGKANVSLAETMPEMTLVDLAALRLRDSELPDAVNGEFLRRNVRAGAPVMKSELKPAPLVTRNDDVVVVVQGNGLVIKAQAVALQYGAEGEWVSVMIKGAEKSTRAKVVAPGVVYVGI